MLHKIVEEESGELKGLSGVFGAPEYKKESQNHKLKSVEIKNSAFVNKVDVKNENPSNEQSGEDKDGENEK